MLSLTSVVVILLSDIFIRGLVAFVCNDSLFALFFVKGQYSIVSIVTRPRPGQPMNCGLVYGRFKRFMCCSEVLKISCGAYPASCSVGWGIFILG